MSQKKKHLQFIDEDGELSGPDVVLAGTTATAEWLHAWLQNHQSTRCLMSRRYEWPYEPILYFLKKTPPSDPGFRTLEGAIKINCEALEKYQFRSSEEQFHNYFSQLFHLCDYFGVRQIRDFLQQELSLLSSTPNLFATKWQSHDTRRKIVLLCARHLKIQFTVRSRSKLAAMWSKVADIPEYSNMALVAYGGSISRTVPILETWWRASPRDVRDVTLGQLIAADENNLNVNKWNELLSQIPPQIATSIDKLYFQKTGNNLTSIPSLRYEPALIDNIQRSIRSIALTVNDPTLTENSIQIVSSNFAEGRPPFEEISDFVFRFWSTRGLPFDDCDDGELNVLGNNTLRAVFPLIFSYPFYLTEEKSLKGFGVIPFAKHVCLGGVIHKESHFKMCFNKQNVASLKSILERLHKLNGGKALSLKKYAMEEMISSQMIKLIVEDKSIDKSAFLEKNIAVPRNEDFYVPTKLGKKDIFIFDLGDKEAVEKQVNSAHFSSRYQTVSIPHDLNVDVGIGFNGIMARLLLQGELLSEFQDGLYSIINSGNGVTEQRDKTFAEMGYQAVDFSRKPPGKGKHMRLIA